MNIIEKRIREITSEGRKAFIAYITAGDPTLADTVRLVLELEKNGVDIIELGVPFSDPVADGTVNQEAAQRALRHNVNISGILDAVREIRKTSKIPIVFFTYMNPILSYGFETFAEDAADAGLNGILALDLPPEEADEYKNLMNGNGIETIFLVSPVTPDDRIERIAKYASGFVYYVSQMGVTGARDSVSASIPDMVKKIRSHTDIPVAVGFGISAPAHVIEASGYADGVIVGSAIVRRIAESGSTPGFEKEIGAYVRTLTNPLKET